ncbi:MAG TPA: hypothetical protein VL551_08475 [Actinospica sp.]|jgi:hypothetical protein|nr:hypothetical protein [Actinospica sp.]
MAGFNAEAVVEPLDYSFRPHVDKAGTIKEPTDRQIAAYLAGVKKLIKDYRGQLPDDLIGGSTDMAAVLSAVEDLDAEVTVRFNADMAGLFADLCSGDPSKDDILALPPRIRAVFARWLQQEVMAPEAAPGGGNAQVKTLRSVAAG